MTRRKPAEVTAVHPVDHTSQVVSLSGGSGQYRRQPCGGCPWRVDNSGDFPAGAFAHSADTAADMSGRAFGCHESGTEHPVTCAGFLLRGAEHNMAVRLKLMSGAIDMSQVTDGGHDLHAGYVTMAVANGLDRRDPALSRCRLSYEEETGWTT